MPLDRTWYNALVDDNGTNTVGTVWNKSQINLQLNSIDNELPTRRAIWNPVWRHETSTGPILSPASNNGQWHRDGDIIHYSLAAISMPIGLACSYFWFTLPYPCAYFDQSVVLVNTVLSMCGPANVNQGRIRRPDGTQYPIATYTIEGTGFYYWR
jgi:hypothetical protein